MGSRSNRPVVRIDQDGEVWHIRSVGSGNGAVCGNGHYRGLPIMELKAVVARHPDLSTAPVKTNRATKVALLDCIQQGLAEHGTLHIPLDIDVKEDGTGVTVVDGLKVPTRELSEFHGGVVRDSGKGGKPPTRTPGTEGAGGEVGEADADSPAEAGTEGAGAEGTESDAEAQPEADKPEPDGPKDTGNPIDDHIVSTVAARFDEVEAGSDAATKQQLGTAIGGVTAYIDEQLAGFQPKAPESPAGAKLKLSENVWNPVELDLPPMAHPELDVCTKVLGAKVHLFLHGPAGSGKSTIVEQAASLLGLECYPMSIGPMTMPTRIWGFVDANGTYHDTPLRRAFESGGVFLMDEVDNGNAGVIAELNQALANGSCTFGDGRKVAKHVDFVTATTANTAGTGADRTYIGRNALDAATLDRFFQWKIDYDLALEDVLGYGILESRSGDDGVLKEHKETFDSWLSLVREVRNYVADRDWNTVVSPRATIMGASLIPEGLTVDHLVKGLLADKFSKSQLAEVCNHTAMEVK